VQYVDHAGKFGRIEVKPSSAPLHWSCRPKGVSQDCVPLCYAERNTSSTSATPESTHGHRSDLCAKNHFGSLVRWPVQKGYYDIHQIRSPGKRTCTGSRWISWDTRTWVARPYST